MNDCFYTRGDRDGFCEEPGGGFDWWQLAMVVMFILMAAGILASCKTKTQIVTVPEYHKEYIVRSDTVARVDSVLLHDSVFVYNVGDTIVINKVAYRDRVRNVYKVRTDTLVRRDSVNIPYPVEKQLTKAQQRYMTIGKCAIVAIAAFAILAMLAILVWQARRMARK